MTPLRVHILLPLMVAFAVGAYGQGAPAAGHKITAAEILQKNLIASGGPEARQTVQSLAARGDVFLSTYPLHMMGDYSFSYKSPSSDMLGMKIVSHGTCWSGRRQGQKAITNCGVEGAGMIDGVSIEIVEQDWRSLVQPDVSPDFDKIELIGRAEVEKRWAYGVRFTPREGDAQVRFYDSETFLLVRMDQVQRFRWQKDEPEVVYSVTSYFRDYKDHAGMKLPHVIAIRRGEGDLLFRITTIHPNAKIADSVFELKSPACTEVFNWAGAVFTDERSCVETGKTAK